MNDHFTADIILGKLLMVDRGSWQDWEKENIIYKGWETMKFPHGSAMG